MLLLSSLNGTVITSADKKDLKKAHTLFSHIAKSNTSMRKKGVWIVNIINFLALIWLLILPVWWARFKISILWFSLFFMSTLIVAETNKMGWIKNVYFLNNFWQKKKWLG